MSTSAHLDEPEVVGGGGFLAHIPAILWQRRWFVIVPTVVGIIGAILANLLIPATYRSSALMLVQSPQIGAGADNATEVVDRRIARIAEQITSRPDLVALIEKHGLYKDKRGSTPLSDILDDMRDAIKLTPTGADISGANANERTIAFRLSFDYAVPAATQAVTQDLMQRIIELDASGNSEQATRRVEFLAEQAKGLEQRIGELQGKIAAVNAQNGSILASGGMMMGGSSGSYDVQIAALQRDNANMITQRDTARKSDNRDPVVIGAETQLAAARAVYSENHPDVVIAKQRLAEARELAKSNTGKLPLDAIDQQIAFNNSQIAALRAAKSQEVAQTSMARAAQSRAPLVQSQLSDLQQQLAGVNEQYKDISAKLFAARAGVRADDEQMGERLAVVEPPVVPDKPVWPDRLIITAAGILGGLGLGLFFALAIELLLQPVRDPAALAAIVGSAPLAMIPVVGKRPDPKAKRGRFPLIGRLWSRSR